jgi:hypothetical protein
MIQSRELFLCSLFGLLSACWYGPAETHHRIEGVARKPNEYTSVAVVYSEMSKPPRGLATFPNGGISKLVQSELAISLLAPLSGGVRVVFNEQVPLEVKNAFSADFVGWKDDSIYLQLSGCPGAECWGEFVNRISYVVKESGTVEEVDRVPEVAKFKGQSLAPMPGERNYIRLGHNFEEISMTQDSGAPPRIIYMLNTTTGHIEGTAE